MTGPSPQDGSRVGWQTPPAEQPAAYDSRPDTYNHIGLVRQYLLWAATDLIRRAHVHDQTKLQPPELEVFDEFTPILRTTKYGSDEYEAARRAMGVGLEHHYSHNDHHPEHFVGGVHSMNLLQILEMICDWMAAVQRSPEGDIRKSIDHNANRFEYGEEIRILLHNTVDALERVFPPAPVAEEVVA